MSFVYTYCGFMPLMMCCVLEETARGFPALSPFWVLGICTPYSFIIADIA